MTFDRFYTYDEITAHLRNAATAKSELVTLYSLGTSEEGREIWCAEVAAAKEEPDPSRRPGLLIQGNLHAVEYSGSMQALYFLDHLLNTYHTDPDVRSLLDEQVVYIIPQVAVDGADYMLRTGHMVRSKHIPVKEKNAPFPQDLDGDGRILTMRWQDPDGRFVRSAKDSRIMLPRDWERDSDGPYYHVNTEGLIHEWDGETVARSRVGNDFNRNFPANWQPRTGTIGWGPYPLSERETRAVADFILAHPNITRAVDFHTGNPAVFYPSAAIEGIAEHADDARLIKKIGRQAQEITGFPFLSGYREAATGDRGERLPGSFKDWMYEHVGVLCHLIEMGNFYNDLGIWTGQKYASGREHEEVSSLLLLEWHDSHPDHRLFFDWRPYRHPQLGEVEIGGWNWPLWRNQPLHKLQEICEKCTRFLLYYADFVPRIRVNATVTSLGTDLFKVGAVIRNTGAVSTAVTRQGLKTHPHAGLKVKISGVSAADVIAGSPYREIGHLEAHRGRVALDWVIKTTTADIELEVASPRGVYVAHRIPLS